MRKYSAMKMLDSASGAASRSNARGSPNGWGESGDSAKRRWRHRSCDHHAAAASRTMPPAR